MDNNLTERHARALLKLHDEQLQLKFEKSVWKRLNVKKTEELVEKAIEKYTMQKENEKKNNVKFTKAIKDIRIFINTIKQAIILMKKSGVDAKAAQFDRETMLSLL